MTLLPAAPAADLSGGGKIAGDPIFDVKEIGVALDQLAREILRHLKDHKLTVVWLFDESTSMQDDQRTILEKFDRVSSELKINVEPNKKSAGALNHAIVGFGQGIDYVLEKPRDDIDQIGRAIKHLKIDPTGIENTMRAIREVVEHYASLIRKDRKLLIVLVTDESGDDGADVEEARQALKKYKVPLYVIGRQSLFGYPFAHHRYDRPGDQGRLPPVDPPRPRDRRSRALPVGRPVRPLGRAALGLRPLRAGPPDQGIRRHLLRPAQRGVHAGPPTRAGLLDHPAQGVPPRVRQPPDLRREAQQLAASSDAARDRHGGQELHLPPRLPHRAGRAGQGGPRRGGKGQREAERPCWRSRSGSKDLAKVRDREPEKRWQAHYDLMLAQTVAFQVKAYEYRALMASIVKAPPVPKRQPGPDLMITWVVDHSKAPLAPANETAKKYAEAERLLKQVIARHPKTPWADLAQDTINRGFSVKFNEWHHNPKYYERCAVRAQVLSGSRARRTFPLKSQRALEVRQDIGDRLETRQYRALFLGAEPALDLLFRGNDRGVIPASEVAADLAVGRANVLAGQVHGHHARIRQARARLSDFSASGLTWKSWQTTRSTSRSPTVCERVADRIPKCSLGEVQGRVAYP